MRSLFYLMVAVVIAAPLFTGCESDADVELGESIPTLVVDAFINNLDEEQRIVLNFSQPFFNTTQYVPARGATVQVTNADASFDVTFLELPTAPGVYTWTAQEGEEIDGIGDDYTLTILYDGKTYTSTTLLQRTTTVDSILFWEEEEIFGDELEIEAQFYGRDPDGIGDTYWIKTFKNDTFLNRPPELNYAYDGGFDPGSDLDGVIFIPPIRQNINPIPLDEDVDEDYVLGDRVRVEIHSITEDTRRFLELLQEQTDRPGGFAELFATPLANLPTNIAISGGSQDERVLGRFSVSVVERLEVTFTEDLLRRDE